MCPDPITRSGRPAGFALPAAIFLLVILALLGAFMVDISGGQQVSSAQDVVGARAYWAARAAVDYAAHRVLAPEDDDPGETYGDPNGAAKFALCPTPLPVAVNLGGSLSGITAAITGCERTPPTGYDTDPETHYRFVTYKLTARASSGTPGNIGRVEREVTAVVVKCKNQSAKLADGTSNDPRNRCQ